MGLFSNQFSDIIEWNESRNDVLFWKWRNSEIKKNSRLIIRPGQDAIFLYNGRVEGIFTEEGNYEIETEILPFLSTLKGFKFGFKSGIKAEVLFINTKEFLVKWGTKSPINIPTPNMPGGMPIRAFGSFNVKISDHMVLIDKIAGIKNQFTVDDVKQRALATLDQLLMKWIVREGKDMFNLQANSFEIAKGIKTDLDMEMIKIGLTVTTLNIENFSYPESVQKIIDKNAAYGMVGNVGHYQNVAMVESMEKNPNNSMSNVAQAAIGIQMGMNIAKEMKSNINNNESNNLQGNVKGIVCTNCGEVINKEAKFCPNCGSKVKEIEAKSKGKQKFCTECGAVIKEGCKFCSECGNKVN
ncbi:SPFH domain-containing protein [Clostridium celatum]|uniref:SPFH domain-containing protein n=1 Tax=Clostridium celatum TaxID=36834 RepID=UPI001897106B|nr:SPFH domain-containing protein [Clostridium celatum]MCE9654703.1 SPFH domain-containing protein [Clostridium celatum]MDU6295846.1 SPFH domain-containing protein [Clostridium celatum]